MAREGPTLPSGSLCPSVRLFLSLGLSSTNFLANKYLFCYFQNKLKKNNNSEASEGWREKENPTERGSKCSEIVFGCHQTVQNLAVGLATPRPGPGRASAAQAFWKVRKVMRELGCSWRALKGVGAWCCLGLCQRAGRRLGSAQMREIRTGMPGDSVLWGE